jgi:hypothetical protein
VNLEVDVKGSWRAGTRDRRWGGTCAYPRPAPTSAKARQEIGAVEAIALGSRGGEWLKTKNVIIIGPFHFHGPV